VVILYQRRARNKQLEVFNATLEAQEAEQGRIARDLHDQLGPTLSVIKMQMDAISDDGLDEMDLQMKHDISSQMEHAINDLRSIAHNLIPKTFTEYGFIKSLNYYILRIKEFNNILITHSLPDWDTPIDRNFEITLFRILQELFQNTLKHAKAQHIDLNMYVENKVLTIHYTDDGVGIKENINISKGIGLNNMANRTVLLNGSMKLNKQLQSGFEIIFTFKLTPHYVK
jgi:signal transduction histidine kinase